MGIIIPMERIRKRMEKKEYIEREKLEKDGWYLQRYVCGDGYAAIENKPLKEVPAADVRPVVRGEWHEYDDDYGKICCSVCEEDAPCDYPWNYCPNCGADMRNADD